MQYKQGRYQFSIGFQSCERRVEEKFKSIVQLVSVRNAIYKIFRITKAMQWNG